MNSRIANKFEVGEQVRVLASTSLLGFEDMERFIGKTGVVEHVDTSNTKYPYLVVFEAIWKVSLSEAELELINKNDMKALGNQLNEICIPKMNKASKTLINQTNNKPINTDITLTSKDIEKLNQFNSVFHNSKHLVELLDSLGNHTQANELMQNLLSVKEVVDNVDNQRNQIAKELMRKECNL